MLLLKNQCQFLSDARDGEGNLAADRVRLPISLSIEEKLTVVQKNSRLQYVGQSPISFTAMVSRWLCCSGKFTVSRRMDVYARPSPRLGRPDDWIEGCASQTTTSAHTFRHMSTHRPRQGNSGVCCTTGIYFRTVVVPLVSTCFPRARGGTVR